MKIEKTIFPPISQVDIFILYAQEDEDLKLELEKHLSISKRLGGISTMDFAQILPGTNRNEQISKMIEKAEIILLMISPNFLNKDMLWDIAINQIKDKNKVLLPVLAKPVFWENSPFAQFQALPLNLKAVTSSDWKNKDEAWMSVAMGITDVTQQIKLGTEPSAIKISPPKPQYVQTYQDELRNIQSKSIKNYSKRQRKYRRISWTILVALIVIGTYMLSPFGFISILFSIATMVVGIFFINALSQTMIWRRNIRKNWLLSGLIASISFLILSFLYQYKLNDYAIRFSILDGQRFKIWIIIGSEFKDDLKPDIKTLLQDTTDPETLIKKIGGLQNIENLYDMDEINKRQFYLNFLFSMVLISFSFSVLFLTELIILPPKQEQLESLV